MADETVPDVFVDQFTTALSPFGIALTFSLSPSSPHPTQVGGGTQKVVVRMSLEHAKSMAMLLRRALKQYELEQIGDPIKIPKRILSQMNLTEDDW